MTAETMKEMIDLRPFHELEVELTSGQKIYIKDPEYVIVMPKRVVIADPENETVDWPPFEHIASVRRREGIFAN